VFQYAMQNWPADDYEVRVVHQGDLASKESVLAARLASLASAQEGRLNCVVKDLNEGTQPSLEVHYPHRTGNPSPVWSAPLSETTLVALSGSPLREEIGKFLLGGKAAVWVFLEGGDRERDGQAFDLLATDLKQLEGTLKVAGQTPPDAATVPAISFATLRLSRSNPAEAFLVNSLLGSEADLASEEYAREPMAFPIYGRGRILYSLVGAGITHENIKEACEFLVGPCSCQVKDLNPGVDLLLAAGWEKVKEQPTLEDVLAPRVSGETEMILPASPALRNTLITLAVLTGLVLAASFMVLGRNKV
jgi:hypothetical protein